MPAETAVNPLHHHHHHHHNHVGRDGRLNASVPSSTITNMITSGSLGAGFAANGVAGAGANAPTDNSDSRLQEESAFWIPQATPDGRLFYYNTLTGVSTLELPVDGGGGGGGSGGAGAQQSGVNGVLQPGFAASNGMSDSGPRDRSNVYIPDHTHPPPELLGETPGLDGSLAQKRRLGVAGTQSGLGYPSFLPGSTELSPDQMTWNKLLEGLAGAVERYRRAINNSDRAEFVLRAEHISDHLRLLLVAGSGTTDNHSGNPSIISSNRSLYPHFRLTMSRFSKLVLSSHIAASDWPPPDSYAKCLAEAKGVLSGVQGFVEVARSQRGDAIPNLVPTFEPDSFTGGNWRGSGLHADGPMSEGAMLEDDDEDDEVEGNLKVPSTEKARRKAQTVLTRLERLRTDIVSEIRALYSFETVGKGARTVSAVMQAAVVSHICRATQRLLERMNGWSVAVEAVDLAKLGLNSQNRLAGEFAITKQATYDLVADIVLDAQDIASPLADEWALIRGPTFDTRLHALLAAARELETNLGTVIATVQAVIADSKVSPLLDGEKNRDIVMGSSTLISSTGETIRTGSGDNTKVKRFFGEVPPGVTSVSTTAPDVPHFLRLDFENEIAYDLPKNGTDSHGDLKSVDKGMSSMTSSSHTNPTLRGGTLMALVEQLTRHDRLDSQFNTTFLLTYKSFTSAPALFEILMSRWSIQPPPGLSAHELTMWTDRKQKPIRFRVVNILKSWIETYWVEDDCPESRELLERVHNFAHDEVVKTNTPGSGPLLSVIDQRLKSDIKSSKKLVLTLSTTTPQPIMPKNVKKLKFLDIDPTELARQLTIVESRLYCQIKTSECLNKTWQRPTPAGEPDLAPNIKALIYHSNQLTNWVAHMILMQKDLRPRVIVIKHFVAVANRCRQLNNFSTLTAIISALGTAPIHRLTKTWAAVSAKTMTTLEAMRKLMASTKNFAEYRDTLQKSIAPCIPFFGVYLTDLTFIEDGISSMIRKTNLINFTKRAKTADVIRSIQSYQNVPYALQPVQPLIEYINSNLQSAKDVHDDMYELSLQVEPKEGQGSDDKNR